VLCDQAEDDIPFQEAYEIMFTIAVATLTLPLLALLQQLPLFPVWPGRDPAALWPSIQFRRQSGRLSTPPLPANLELGDHYPALLYELQWHSESS
jgi:hypothetical protein